MTYILYIMCVRLHTHTYKHHKGQSYKIKTEKWGGPTLVVTGDDGSHVD